MRLCLDENLRSRELLRRLRSMGHEVIAPDLGIADAEVFAFAQQNRAAILTGNAVDFAPFAAS